jgi:hypothetical protein
MRRVGGAVSLLALALLLPGIGCSSFSDSSRSISKSVSSPSASSSEDNGNPVYMRKIRDYSYGYAKSGGDPEAFVRGISALAQRSGIHDWESNEDTCRAIGEGFKDAGAGQSGAHAAFAKIVAGDSKCAHQMRAGYHER